MKRKVFFNFLTSIDARSGGVGEIFFEALKDGLECLVPERYGVYHPLKDVGSVFDAKDAAKHWCDDMEWECKRTKCWGMVTHGSRYHHTAVQFHFDQKYGDETTCVEFLKEVSLFLEIDLASVHIIDETSPSKKDSYFIQLVSLDIQDFLPGLPWACCFGKVYSDMIGASRLVSPRFFETEEMDNGMVYCRLTETWDEVFEQPQFDELRDEIIKEIGSEFFLDHDNPNRKCKVPQFDLKDYAN